MTALLIRSSDLVQTALQGQWSIPKFWYWAATVIVSLAMWWGIFALARRILSLIA
jgi:hypothetical protein